MIESQLGHVNIGRKRRDDSVGVDLSNPAVTGVCYKNITLRVHRDAIRRIQAGLESWATIAGKAPVSVLKVLEPIDGPAAGDCGDDSGPGIYATDAIVIGVSNEDVTGTIDSHAPRLAKQRVGCRTAIARISQNPVASGY